jgi:drug/metabolite transporter (DMT)-like permease
VIASATPGHRSGEALGWLAALGAVSIWAGWAVATRASLLPGGAGIAVVDLIALRFAVAGLVTVPIAAANPPPIVRLGALRSVLAASMGGFTFSLCNTGGLVFAPAAHGGALTPTLGAVFTGTLAALLLGERLTRLRLAGLALILLGAAILLAVTLASDAPASIFIGHALFATAALQWSLYTITIRSARLAPLPALALANIGSAVLYLPPWLVLRGPGAMWALPLRVLVEQGVLHGVLTQVVSVVLFNLGVLRLGAARAASCGALVPPLVALGAALFLAEPPQATELPGLAAVTVGVWLASRKTGPAPPSAPAKPRELPT